MFYAYDAQNKNRGAMLYIFSLILHFFTANHMSMRVEVIYYIVSSTVLGLNNSFGDDFENKRRNYTKILSAFIRKDYTDEINRI